MNGRNVACQQLEPSFALVWDFAIVRQFPVMALVHDIVFHVFCSSCFMNLGSFMEQG